MAIFVPSILPEGKFCVISQCIVYCKYSEYTYFCISKSLHFAFCCLFLKCSKVLSEFLKYYLPKGMSTNYKAIINGKNLYDQLIDSDTKRCEDAYYTTEYVLDYDYTTRCRLYYRIRVRL